MNKNQKTNPKDAAYRDLQACFGEIDSSTCVDSEDRSEYVNTPVTEAWKKEYATEIKNAFAAIQAKEKAVKITAIADSVLKGSIGLSIGIAILSVALMLIRTCTNRDPGKPFV